MGKVRIPALMAVVLVAAALTVVFGCSTKVMHDNGPLTLPGKAPVEGEPVADEGKSLVEGEGKLEPGDVTLLLPGDVPLELMLIPSGTFLMGRYADEQHSYDHENPQHPVTIAQDFYMGKYEVTKRQWQAVMGTTPWSENRRDSMLNDLDSPRGIFRLLRGGSWGAYEFECRSASLFFADPAGAGGTLGFRVARTS